MVLLRQLQSSYGICSTVLDWFTSYLEQRVHYVRFEGCSSTPSTLLCGVPQGSVLGPILFLLYTADLIRLVEIRGQHPHLFADDSRSTGLAVLRKLRL